MSIYIFYGNNKYTLSQTLYNTSDYFKEFSEYSQEFHLKEYEEEFKIINNECIFMKMLDDIKDLYVIKEKKRVKLYKDEILSYIKLINNYHTILNYFGNSSYLKLLHETAYKFVYNTSLAFIYNKFIYKSPDHSLYLLAMNEQYHHILNIDYYTNKFISKCYNKKFTEVIKTTKLDYKLVCALSIDYYNILLYNDNIPFEWLESKFNHEYHGFSWLQTRTKIPYSFLKKYFYNIDFNSYRKLDFVPFQLVEENVDVFEHLVYNLSSNTNIPLEFLERYRDHIDWYVISLRKDITRDFIARNLNRVVWLCVSFNEHIPLNIYEEFHAYADWHVLSHKKSDNEFMERNIDRIDFQTLIFNKHISKEFISKYIDKFLKIGPYAFNTNLPLDLIESKVVEMGNKQKELLNKKGLLWSDAYGGKYNPSKFDIIYDDRELTHYRLEYEEFWQILCTNHYLDMEFYEKYYNIIPKHKLLLLSSHEKLTIEFLEKHPECISIRGIVYNHYIPIYYKLKFKDRFMKEDYAIMLSANAIMLSADIKYQINDNPFIFKLKKN
jgi:hypothetical protein